VRMCALVGLRVCARAQASVCVFVSVFGGHVQRAGVGKHAVSVCDNGAGA
jgi:hypothetical protein